MLTILRLLFSSLRSSLRSRAALQAEILALRHQLLVLQRSTQGRRVRFHAIDRVFWVWFSGLWQRLALSCPDHEGRHCHCVEPQRVPTVLDLEEPRTPRPTLYVPRHRQSHTKDELSESRLGCSAHSRRIAQARYRCR